MSIPLRAGASATRKPTSCGLHDERSAQSRLEDILGSETRNAIAKHDLIEIVRTDKTRKPLRDENLAKVPTGLGTIGVLPPIQFRTAEKSKTKSKAKRSGSFPSSASNCSMCGSSV